MAHSSLSLAPSSWSNPSTGPSKPLLSLSGGADRGGFACHCRSVQNQPHGAEQRIEPVSHCPPALRIMPSNSRGQRSATQLPSVTGPILGGTAQGARMLRFCARSQRNATTYEAAANSRVRQAGAECGKSHPGEAQWCGGRIANLTHCGRAATLGIVLRRVTNRSLPETERLMHDLLSSEGAMTDDVARGFRRLRWTGSGSCCTITGFRNPCGMRTSCPVLRCSANTRAERYVH